MSVVMYMEWDGVTRERELRSLGSDALALGVDVADERSVDAMVNETVRPTARARAAWSSSPDHSQRRGHATTSR